MKIDISGAVNNLELENIRPKVTKAFNDLINRQGKGNDFLGWIDLPEFATQNSGSIKKAVSQFASGTEAIVVIGIGGSNLGAKAVYEALKTPFGTNTPELLFAGNNLDQDYHYSLLKYLDNKEYGIIVISKSGTTTEPAIAFRLLKNHLEQKYGKEKAKTRIIAITDKSKGALRKIADSEGYLSYIIPDDVGGRYSVLSPVGLVPLAAAGIDIEAMAEGAFEMKKTVTTENFEKNPALLYAATRNILYGKGKKVEILVNYNTALVTIAEWWKQLFGESEGKEGKGIFPASANFTTDLHSLGQYIQEGERLMFETVIKAIKPAHDLTIPHQDDNSDSLEYLAGKPLDYVNTKAMEGTMLAHTSANVPNILIQPEKIDAYNLGKMIYFFEFSCAVSGYVLGVNPFDQPGVEQYKKNMFALLGKPGYEAEKQKLEALLNKNHLK